MNKLLSFSLVPLAATATVASIALTPDSAQALLLNGTISINGTSLLSYSDSDVLVDFKDIDGVTTTGSFSSFVDSLSDVIDSNDSSYYFAISDLTLATGGNAPFNYTNNGLASFLNFGTRQLGSETGILTFDLGKGDYLVQDISGSPNIISSNILPGLWKFNGDTIAIGSVSATQFGGNSSYTITVEAVPEPLTILGTGLALGLGGLFKSKQSKKQSLEA